jgi:hypothetical protein
MTRVVPAWRDRERVMAPQHGIIKAIRTEINATVIMSSRSENPDD